MISFRHQKFRFSIAHLENNVSFSRMTAGATHVLIVDDDLADTLMLQETLQKFGVESINSLVTGEEATKYILGLPPFQLRALPDLIFVDLNMAGINGFQLISWMKANPLSNAIPLVVFSGSNDALDKNKALSLGAAAYHQKTSEVEKLKAMVESVLTLG